MKSILAKAGFIGVFLILLSVAGCSKDSSNPYGNNSTGGTNAPPNTVVMSGMAFSPTAITIAKNTTVTWMNNDGVSHTSTSNTGVWDTGNIPAGGSKTTTFTTSGTFPYHCTYHSNMTGTVIVQ